jgi:acetyltransferase-like isoleucine patch superfamily enzyme
MKRKIKLLFNFISTVYTRIRFSRIKIGKGSRIGFCANISVEKGGLFIIGNNSFFGGDATVLKNAICIIGDNTHINKGCTLGIAIKIIIGNEVMIAHDVTIFDNNNHPINKSDRKKIAQSGFNREHISWTRSSKSPVVINNCTWIGMHSIILKGVTIGEGSIIAAGSVVTKDVPQMTVYGGNPSGFLKYVPE